MSIFYKLAKYIKLITFLTLIIYVVVIVFPQKVYAWYSNPYPNPGGTFDCTYSAWIDDNIYNLQILSGGGNIKWLQAVNNTPQATWRFPLIMNYAWPVGSWPSGYQIDPNTDAETFTQHSVDDSFAFQDGGPGSWEMQTIPNGQYHIPFTGNLDISKLSVSFWTTTNMWSKECTLIQPTTTPTSTPFPSPTPMPVTKVVVIPGLGASWNADALINCKSSSSTPWILAPYAEDVYTPILQALGESNWSVIPYYYDWRRPVQENSTGLSNLINSETVSEEKIDLVGHSMGGLVGRSYLSLSSGTKLEKLLTVGTPNKGSALAYPPWEGGDVWNNNFIEKIALTLYLKHCGGITSNDKETIRTQVPSLQNLLPTEAYLQKVKSDILYLPESDANKNNWLESLSSDSWGVRLGYIAGTGFDTLKTIQTKDPSKNDVKNGYWEDGKPAGKIFSNEGDGTVLLDSAILPNASFSAVINQTHRGLVNSIEGMGKVLEFLGNLTLKTTNTFTVSNPVATDPKSVLVIVGHPGSFYVTDEEGKVSNSKDGIVSIPNPKNGNYQLKITPLSTNTTLIIAQFLPNNLTLYKEYKLKGLVQETKVIEFNSGKPKEDLLKNIDDYKKPNFPKHWSSFWNDWKTHKNK